MEHDRRLRAYEQDMLRTPLPWRQARAGFSHQLLEGLSPGEFSEEARALSEAAALSPRMAALGQGIRVSGLNDW